MAWDFETEPEFEAKLAWMREFVKEEIFPLETLAPEFRSPEGRVAFAKVTEPLKQQVKDQGPVGRTPPTRTRLVVDSARSSSA